MGLPGAYGAESLREKGQREGCPAAGETRMRGFPESDHATARLPSVPLGTRTHARRSKFILKSHLRVNSTVSSPTSNYPSPSFVTDLQE